ncbi:PAS domain S-box protein [uncultured Fibrella sp.]|uniref:PAS domain-containing sensor histidine kinase n=1 Tax=uncultured Fibrella sp. TaxID=1284596 RepID=UPI0035C966C1
MTGGQTASDQDSTAHAQNERLIFALQAAGVGTWDYDLQTGQAEWSGICKELFGLSPDADVTSGILLEQVHPDDRLRVDKANREALDPAGNGHHNIVFRTLNQAGTIRWVEAKGKTTRNGQGQIIRFSGIIQDVTPAVLAKEQVDIVQRQLLDSFEQSTVAIAIITEPNLTFRRSNLFFSQLAGRQADELVGKSLLDALPELAGQRFDSVLRQVMATGVPYIAQETAVNLTRSGKLETIYVDLTCQPMRGTQERVTGVLIVATDVTQQVLARRKIEESEAKLRSIIASAPAGIGLFVGRDLIIEMPNQTFIDIIGKGPDIEGKPLREAMPELITGNQPFLQILDDVFTSGQMFQSFGSQVDIARHGIMTHNFYNITYTPLLDREGKVYAILDIAVDVTPEILARQHLSDSEARYRHLSAELEKQVDLRTQELETSNEELAATNEELLASNDELTESTELLIRSNENLQRFAYIASHDLQEPLRKIQQFGSLLQNQYADALGEGVDYLQRMQVAAGRMSTLIRDLLAFSRISTWQDSRSEVSLDEVVGLVLTDLEIAIQETSAVVRVDRLPLVLGDYSQLGQLFQNLLSNALKFKRPDVVPEITVRAFLITASQLPGSVKPARLANVYHRIDVSDNGIGFEQKYTERIFQVFQRLHGKNQYAGTGIGLAICEKVVFNHGGAITATGEPGRGATFSVYLPT